MSEPQARGFFVTSHQNQPVELFLPSGLLVLPPHGEARVTEADLEAPQLRVLVAGRLLSTRETTPADRAEAPAKASPAPEGETDGGEASPEE